MRGIAKTLVLFIFSLSLFFGVATPVSAAFLFSQGTSVYQQNSNIQDNVAETINAVVKAEEEGLPSNESFVDSNLGSLQTSTFLFVAGPPDTMLTSLTEEQRRIVYQRYGRGVIPEITRATAALYTPPASSRTYIADVLESAHIIPQAQAQGVGFSALDPILNVWKVFRNVAYLFFVIIFLIIGFMIMFRQKINGQTVVTAQQAIPGVIVALIFVTFSYAIAGFLIDLMYLVMYLMIGLFQPVGGSDWISKNIFQATIDVIKGSGEINSVFSTVSDAVEGFAESITNPLSGPISQFLGWIGGITVGLIVSIAILIASFKVFFELLKTYVTIVLSIATAPLTLMMGAIPGKNNLAQWLKIIAGNLMAFPVVLMSFIVYDMFSQNDFTTGGFLPPYLVGQGNGGVIITLVGIGILLIIPDLIKQVKKSFGAEGGIWEQLGGEMVTSAKRGWSGEGLGGWGVGKVAKPLAKGAGLVGATGVSAGLGHLSGGLYNVARGKSFKMGAKKGREVGAILPGVVASGLHKNVYSTIKGALGKELSSRTLGAYANKVDMDEATAQRYADYIAGKVLSESAKSSVKKPASRTTKPPKF